MALTATLREHDSVIFHDNDFEVFIKPLPQTEASYEFEMNAFNAGWDLFLNKPYNENGKLRQRAGTSSASKPPPSRRYRERSTTRMTPIRDGRSRSPIPCTPSIHARPCTPPQPGTVWRINFSRVEWTPGNPKEDNWVWSPQGVIDMHVPDRWGYLRFR